MAASKQSNRIRAVSERFFHFSHNSFSLFTETVRSRDIKTDFVSLTQTLSTTNVVCGNQTLE